MDSIAGFSHTGKRLLGPASDLVELEAENGLRHTAIVFHPEYRQHSSITDALEVVRGFLESPLVTGLVELVGHDRQEGAFIYPTGPVWSVAEIIRVLSDLGEPAGMRAGLELMYTAGQILVEGAEAGSAQGVYSHGGLSPRRIMVKRDGQVMVIGYALPQVEILQFSEDGAQVPREDAFRYCPPERLEGRAEQLSSDLFGLALIGFELMTGKPVYDGLVNDIRQQAARGEGSRRLFRFREVMDQGVKDVLTRMLRPDLSDRYVDGEDFLGAVHGLLSQRQVTGPSLIDLMEKVVEAGQRQGQEMEPGRTMMVAKDALASDLESSQSPQMAEGRSPERTWSPGRRRAVQRGQPDPDQVMRASRTEDPADPPPPPTVVDVEESMDAPVADAAPRSHRWSKVQRASSRRQIPREQEGPSAVAKPERTPARLAPPPPLVPDSTGDWPPVLGDEDSDSAEALIAAIRGKPEPSLPTHSPEPVRPLPASVPVTSTDEAATVMMSREQLRATVASALEQDQGVMVLDTAQAESSSHDAPTLSLHAASVGGMGTFELAPQAGGAGSSVSLPLDATSAEAVGWLVGSAVPIPSDLSGRLTGWYRLEQGGQTLEPGIAMSQVDAGVPIALRFVASESVSAQIEVVQGESTVRFMSPVGSAIPVASLVAHLCGWLGLSAGRWVLLVNGAQLPDHAIIADVDMPGDLSIVLRRDGT